MTCRTAKLVQADGVFGTSRSVIKEAAEKVGYVLIGREMQLIVGIEDQLVKRHRMQT